MIAGLETFAKVRALHDRTEHLGEKVAAAGRMEALARAAGMTIGEAVSILDGPSRNFQGFREDLHASSAAWAAEDILARKDAERRAAVLAEVGSEEAVWVKTEREIALGLACRWLLRCSNDGKDVVDTLMGWRSGSFATMPREVRNAMTGAYPLPSAVHEAWAEFLWWEKLVDHRRAFCPVYSADVRVCARMATLEHLLDSLPGSTPQDLQARLDWMQYVLDHRSDRCLDDDQTCLSSLRAHFEQLSVQNGQGAADHDFETTKRAGSSVQSGHDATAATSDDPYAAPPVQSGHNMGASGRHTQFTDGAHVQNGRKEGEGGTIHPTHVTTAEKRRKVAALLTAVDAGGRLLTDREISRRVGVSPTTVGNVRRASAEIAR